MESAVYGRNYSEAQASFHISETLSFSSLMDVSLPLSAPSSGIAFLDLTEVDIQRILKILQSLFIYVYLFSCGFRRVVSPLQTLFTRVSDVRKVTGY
jgi:hypothetical protein